MTRSMKVAGAGLLTMTGVLSLLAAPRTAAAQYTNPYTFRNWNNPISNYLDVRLQQRMQARRLQERILEKQRAGDAAALPDSATSAAAGTTPSASVRQPINATDFPATGTRLLPATLADATPGATREQKDQLETLYGQVLTAFEEQARKNNVAYALTFLIGASMQVANNRELSEMETELLAQELNDVLSSSPEFLHLKPLEKQSLYEAAVITGGMIGVIHQIGVDQNNQDLREQAKEMAGAVTTQLLGAREP